MRSSLLSRDIAPQDRLELKRNWHLAGQIREGYPLAYRVLAGNTQDKQTLRGLLDKIEALDGKADRIWVMDRGMP